MAEKYGLVWLTSRSGEGYSSIWRHLPRFTSSLDAAMTLVPPGWEALIDGVGSERAKRWIVELYPEDGSDRIEHGAADTSPLALCAAALRARAS